MDPDVCDFEPVTVGGSWCYEDQLLGKPLQEGEVVEVCWADGTTSRETICLKKYGYDSGHEGWIPIREAYVQRVYRGTPFSISLKHPSILLRRVLTN